MKYRAFDILTQRTTREGVVAWEVRILDPEGVPVDEAWGDADEETAVAWARSQVDLEIERRRDDEVFGRAMAEAALAAPRSAR